MVFGATIIFVHKLSIVKEKAHTIIIRGNKNTTEQNIWERRKHMNKKIPVACSVQEMTQTHV